MENKNSSVNTLKEVLIDSLDFSTSFVTWNFPKNHLLNYKKIALHFEWSGLTGTLNGSFKVQQSNDTSLSFIDIPGWDETLSNASDSKYFESDFNADNLNIQVTRGGITAGTLKVVMILK